MSARTRSWRRQPRRSPDGAQQHRDWLSLVDVDGPFLSLPVLRKAWPTLDSLDRPTRDHLRLQHSSWQADPAVGQRMWIEYVLRELLGWGEDLRWAEAGALDTLAVDVSEHDALVAPTFALVRLGMEVEPAVTELVGLVCAPDVHPTARITGDDWAANSADRLAHLCRTRDIQLGLVTDGRWWTLVWARSGNVTASATFDAIGWPETADRDVVRAFVSLLSRQRFFGVPESGKLVALLAASEDSQEEITEALGVQVRQAVELLVAAIGRADTAQQARGEGGLTNVDARDVYRAAVTVMMRIVFLLFAEERKMLPSDNDLYATSYAVGQLCAKLERRALESSEDDLEHSVGAWHRLLGLFDAVYYGIDHPRLAMYPHDGSLFDTTTTGWFPRTIDDRTVLHMLRAVQFIETGAGKARERRKLSFRELQVEQIGYVYEGLLAYDGFRANEVTVSLVGKRGFEREVALPELEAQAAGTGAIPELAARIAQEYKDSGIGSARALERRLAPLATAEKEDARRKLLAATRGDYRLAERLMPFARVIRDDLRGLPVVIMPGELFVTESPLRRFTGTHYTPRNLAELVVKDALEPLVYSPGPLQTYDRSQWVLKSSDEILALKVADIAMGSGAFLVSAAHYLGERLVEAWTREGDERALLSQISRVVGDTDEDPVVIEARRQVIEHCLYGVDINPAAVEIAKVSLWLISMSPDLPFTFLDDRLKTGDSLLGITSLDQLWHMHLDPDRGRDIHHDLFRWVEPGRALMEKVADARLRVTEIDVRDDPLGRLAEKRKLLKEIDDDTAELRRNADLLVGSALAHAREGTRGFTRGAVDAARLTHNKLRGLDDTGLARVQQWLATERPDIGFPRKPFHWPLELPEAFRDRGGFDAIVGNKPYLGGQKLTGALGEAYREYLIHALANGVRGSADLIAYFALRASELINDTGTMGLVATNTLAQGDTRQVGLDQVVASGITIYDAIKSMPWPSKSSVLECCVVWGSKARVDSRPGMSPSLDSVSRVVGKPERLAANRGMSFQGSNILGLGFTMDPSAAQGLISKDPRNVEVLYPYLNGQDVNSNPDHAGSRWVINFFDWPEQRARNYRDCFDQVQRLVRPERVANKYSKTARERWWLYERARPELYEAVSGLDRVIVMAQVSKTVMPALVSTDQVFDQKLVVFATDDQAMLALLSSGSHYWWTIRRSATMKTDTSYSPTDVFETFPLPELTDDLRQLGARLDTFRREVMLSRQSGLTKTYNLVCDPTRTDSDIEELRRFHRAIDDATIRAYGWEDRIETVGGLDHGFHKVGRETRYTIGPAAQREVLDSLLELNHERYAEEVAQSLHDKKRRTRKPISTRQDTLPYE